MSLKNEQQIYKYYSQHGEDYLLWNFFDFKDSGYFIEVGAFDGCYLSNTFSFEQKAWSGICIEPIPDFFEMCKTNRPDSVCLNLACVGNDDVSEIDFYFEQSGVFSSISDTSSYQGHLKEQYYASGFKFAGRKKISVKAASLNSILSEHISDSSEIDFVTIDVESYEEEVLKGFDINKFSPRVVIIEANDASQKRKITRIMHDNYGYSLARELVVNLVFVKTPDDIKKMQSIAIDCAIEKQMHPLGSDYSFSPFVKGVVYTESKDRLLSVKDGQLEKRLELLKINGTNWKQCEKKLNELSGIEALDERISTMLASIESIVSEYSRILVYGAGGIASIFNCVAPASIIAYIDDGMSESLESYRDKLVITPGDLDKFIDYPIVITTSDTQSVVHKLVNLYGIEPGRIIELVQ